MQMHEPMHFLHVCRPHWGQPTTSLPGCSSNSVRAISCNGETGDLCDGPAFQMTRVKPTVSNWAKRGAKGNRGDDKVGKRDGGEAWPIKTQSYTTRNGPPHESSGLVSDCPLAAKAFHSERHPLDFVTPHWRLTRTSQDLLKRHSMFSVIYSYVKTGSSPTAAGTKTFTLKSLFSTPGSSIWCQMVKETERASPLCPDRLKDRAHSKRDWFLIGIQVVFIPISLRMSSEHCTSG